MMNLIMALMVNQMNMDEAEAMLQTHRVEEISDKIEVTTIKKKLRAIFCNFGESYSLHSNIGGHSSSVEDGKGSLGHRLTVIRSESVTNDQPKSIKVLNPLFVSTYRVS